MPVLSKKATDSIFIIIPEWISRLKGLLILPLIVGVIGLEGYGVYVLIIANIALLTPLVHLAMGQAVVRYGAVLAGSDRKALARMIWTPLLYCAGASMVLSAVLLALVPLLSQWLLEGRHAESLAVAVPLLFTNGAALILAPYLNSRDRFKEASLFRLAKDLLPYLGLGLGVVLWKELTAGIVLSVLVSYGVVAAMLLRVYRETGRPSFDAAIFRRQLSFSWPLASTNVLQAAMESAPRYVIPLFLGASTLGLYNILYMLSHLLIQFDEPLIRYLNSKAPVRWDAGMQRQTLSMIERCVLYYIVVAIFSGLAMVLLLEDAIRLLLPSVDLARWSGITGIMAILALFGLVYGVNNFAWITAKLKERSRLILGVGAAGLLIHLPATYVLTWNFGLVGAATAQLLTVSVMQFLFMRLLDIQRSRVFIWSLVKIAVLAAVMLGIMALLPHSSLPWLFVGLAVGTVVYWSGIHGLGVVTYQEVRGLLFAASRKPV